LSRSWFEDLSCLTWNKRRKYIAMESKAHKMMSNLVHKPLGQHNFILFNWRFWRVGRHYVIWILHGCTIVGTKTIFTIHIQQNICIKLRRSNVRVSQDWAGIFTLIVPTTHKVNLVAMVCPKPSVCANSCDRIQCIHPTYCYLPSSEVQGTITGTARDLL
jgi:hypothetical protein